MRIVDDSCRVCARVMGPVTHSKPWQGSAGCSEATHHGTDRFRETAFIKVVFHGPARRRSRTAHALFHRRSLIQDLFRATCNIYASRPATSGRVSPRRSIHSTVHTMVRGPAAPHTLGAQGAHCPPPLFRRSVHAGLYARLHLLERPAPSMVEAAVRMLVKVASVMGAAARPRSLRAARAATSCTPRRSRDLC